MDRSLAWWRSMMPLTLCLALLLVALVALSRGSRHAGIGLLVLAVLAILLLVRRTARRQQREVGQDILAEIDRHLLRTHGRPAELPRRLTETVGGSASDED